jgi:hypothetical protein
VFPAAEHHEFIQLNCSFVFLLDALSCRLARDDLGTNRYSERVNRAPNVQTRWEHSGIQRICSKQPLCKLPLMGALLLTTS